MGYTGFVGAVARAFGLIFCQRPKRQRETLAPPDMHLSNDISQQPGAPTRLATLSPLGRVAGRWPRLVGQSLGR